MLESSLTTLLKTITPNVYPVVAPKNYTTPCVIYQRVLTRPLTDLGGYAGCELVWIQVKAVAPEYGTARTLAEQCCTAILAWRSPDFDSVSWYDDADMVDNTTEIAQYSAVNRFVFFVQPDSQ